MVGKILIVDDVATNRIVFKVKLGAACYRPVLAADGASCLRLAHGEAPDLILLDLILPDISGIAVLERLRADPVTCDIPVVVVSAVSDAAARLAAFRAGADDFLTKPFDDQVLLARVRNLLRAREAVAELGRRGAPLQALGLAEGRAEFAGPGCVALVAALPETALRWRRELAPVLSDRIVVLTCEQALAEDGTDPAPDVFVIEADLGMPSGGMRLLSDLRSRAATRHAAICILRSDAAVDSAAMAYDLGANDLMDIGFQPRELALRLRNLMRRKRAADHSRAAVQDGLRLAAIDPLTGLYNRRYALPRLAAIADAARASGAGFAAMVVDLDRFKAVNDRWGHGAGDAVLVEVARRLSDSLRQGDLLARVGGEEFLVVLPDADLAAARSIAERLCAVVQERPITVPGNASLTVTVSIGLAIGRCGEAPQIEAAVEVVDRADRALLVAKAGGRNQVTVSHCAA